MKGDQETTTRIVNTEMDEYVSKVLQSSEEPDLDKIAEFLRRNPENLKFVLREMCRLHQMPGVVGMEQFREETQRILKENPDKEYFVWYTGIYDFSQLTDRYGYEFGARVEEQLLHCLQSNLSGNLLICRLFGDCFVGLRCMEGQTIGTNMNRIREQMDDFFVENNRPYSICIHIGVYHVTEEDIENPDAEKMLSCARTAQKSLKNTVGFGLQSYDSEFIQTMQRKKAILGHLDQAIEDGEISVFYQPQYDYFSNRLIGAEALCRWNHSTLGPISPGEFIPILEEFGDISKLDTYIWESVCKNIRKWLDMGVRVPISINVSRMDIVNMDLPRYFSDLINRYQLEVDLLRIEITETAYIEKSDQMISMAAELKKAGFMIEMDDFGSGFSSLNMLKDVPVDVLKLDLRFLQGDSNADKGGNIISYIIRMAQSMNMCVLAEGVETRLQADMLKNLNCGWMQGYYFARPICESEFENLLRSSTLDQDRENRNSINYDYVQELMDRNSNSSYIFNSCLGGAAILSYNREKLELIMANEKAYECLGIDREYCSAYAKDLLQMLPLEQREIIRRTVQNVIVNKEGKTELDLANGRWINFFMRYLYSNSGENFIFVQMEDATEHHMIQQKFSQVMEESKEHYEKLKMLTHIPGMVIYDYDVAADCMVMTVTDIDGMTRNHVAEEWMRRLPEEAWMRPDSIETLLGAIRKVCDGSDYETVDAYALYKDKCYHNSRYHFFPIKDSLGKVYRVIGRADRIE